MDIKEQVTKLVENKIEKILTEDLRKKITDENTSFDVETYVDNLLDKYFNENDVINPNEELSIDSCDSLYCGSENSSDESNNSLDSLEFDSNGYHTFSIEEIIKYLKTDSEEVKIKSLQALEVSAEDLINLSSWNKLKETLQKMLNNSENREIQSTVLKIFQKFLKHSKKTQIVCKGFITVAEIVTNQINFFNSKNNGNTSFEKIYSVKENKWKCEKKFTDFKNSNFTVFKNQQSVNIEVLIKLMWLLIDCQQQIPIKWMRFNETLFHEIIFSFVHLLSSTTTKQDAKLSGLQLLSVLNPKASWCRYWCHTVVGRSLLCSALRKYKNFFVLMVEIILNHMKKKKSNGLPQIKDSNLNANPSKFESNVTETLKSFRKCTKTNQIESEKSHLKTRHLNDKNNHSCSAPSKLKETTSPKHERSNKSKNSSPTSVIVNIPNQVINEAVFLHSVSFVSYLIQFRSGRALFPVQIATRKRLLNIQDLAFSIIEYLEDTENYKSKNAEIIFTSAYETKVSEILHILKKIKTHFNSSRISIEKQQFSYP